MAFKAKAFAGSHCGCRYQQDYRPTLGRDGKKESGTLEVIKFYYDGAIRMEQHYYDEDYLPQKLDRVDEAGNLYFDGSPFPWKLADDFAEDPRWGYPRWKVVLGKLLGKRRVLQLYSPMSTIVNVSYSFCAPIHIGNNSIIHIDVVDYITFPSHIAKTSQSVAHCILDFIFR